MSTQMDLTMPINSTKNAIAANDPKNGAYENAIKNSHGIS